MKICYIAPDVEIPHFRGGATHVMELSSALAALGDEVYVICRRRPSQPKDERIGRVAFRRLYRGLFGPLTKNRDDSPQNGGSDRWVSRLYTVYLNTAFALYSGIEASRIILEESVQVILERETAFGAGGIAAKLCKIPLVLEMIGPRYSPISMSTSSKVLAYTEAMVPSIARSKTTYVTAAVNPLVFRPNDDARRNTRERYGLKNSVVVGYIGTFQTWHGVNDLIHAAKLVLATRQDVRFLLVGPYNSFARKVAEEAGVSQAMLFPGAVEYLEVPDYINACDIMVAPYNVRDSSRRDSGIGSPLKILEYMACGKPVIGSSLPQVKQLIEDWKTGLLFAEGDFRELAEKILLLAGDMSMREQLAARALSHAKDYTWSSLAKTIRSILLEAARGSTLGAA
jgi:glycosyltransferase involved in cell wall biosynthesis